MQVKKQQLKPAMEQLTVLKLGKEYDKGIYSHPLIYVLCRVHHVKWLDESQAGINISQRNINNFRYADNSTLMAESEDELKSLLMRVEKESAKASLKLNIEKLRSWHPIPSLHGK